MTQLSPRPNTVALANVAALQPVDPGPQAVWACWMVPIAAEWLKWILNKWNHQKPSETIRNHQKPSETIRNDQKRSETIRNHQKPRFLPGWQQAHIDKVLVPLTNHHLQRGHCNSPWNAGALPVKWLGGSYPMTFQFSSKKLRGENLRLGNQETLLFCITAFASGL